MPVKGSRRPREIIVPKRQQSFSEELKRALRRHRWRLGFGALVSLLLVSVAVQLVAHLGFTSQAKTGTAQEDGSAVLRRPGPANGIFPPGCHWRDIQLKGTRKRFWAVEEYEYWSDEARGWTGVQPAACLVGGQVVDTRSWAWRNGSPRSQAACDDTHCVYDNLWYNNGQWYLLVADGNPAVDWWPLSRNLELRVLHVGSAAKFAESIDFRVVKGDTLLWDYVFFYHPTAIGHWGEMIFPLFSVLLKEDEFSVPPDRVLLLHLKRAHLAEWVRAVVATALGFRRGSAQLPPIGLQEEQDDVWAQMGQPLAGVPRGRWLCFERALVARDVLSGGPRTFLRREDAVAFRAAIYRDHGLPPPLPRAKPPQIITYQRKKANRRIVNERQFISLLREYAEVRVVEFDASTPFGDQLAAIAATGVLVSAHTSNLASAQFLRPGAAVVEVIQRNWVWNGIDRTFKAHTEMMGDIHHFAWRARFRNQTVYLNARDGEKFGAWPGRLCDSEDCVEAHTNVDVVVNLVEFRALLDATLPRVFEGAAVADVALPWPADADEPAATEGDPMRSAAASADTDDGRVETRA